MFLGEYTTAKTAGNRVAVPKKIREQFNNKEIIVTRGYEGCIVVVMSDQFEVLLEGVSSVPFISADKREASRFLLSGAHKVEMDAQGRVIIPPSLVEHAGLEGEEVIFIGVGNWVEIWDSSRWREYQKTISDQSQEIANRLLELNKNTSVHTQ